MKDFWIPSAQPRRQSFYNLAFLLLLEALYNLGSEQEVSEFNRLAYYLHKRDTELQDFETSGHGEDERLETLDASLAANIIQARLDNINGEINDLTGIRGGDEEADSRLNWCQTMKHKLQEALVRLYSMLKEYSRAVKLSM